MNINVIVHFEHKEAAWETPLSETVGDVRSRAERELLIADGTRPGLTLTYQDHPLDNPGETLQQLLKGASEERIEFRLDFSLIVNTAKKWWPKKFITGAEILVLAGSPSDWVVNEIVPGPGEDPEIGPDQPVDLAFEVAPPGIKKFKTRKPHTNPGQ